MEERLLKIIKAMVNFEPYSISVLDLIFAPLIYDRYMKRCNILRRNPIVITAEKCNTCKMFNIAGKNGILNRCKDCGRIN